MSVTEKRYVTQKEFILYGVANGGQILSWKMISSYITYFYTNIFNIDARIVSAMMFIEGIWDAANDPIMGSVIDKTRTRYGKLRPYLLGVPVPLAITTIAMFAGPLLVGDYASTDPKKVAYMIITYFMWEFFYTIGDVSFWGMSAAVSPNPEERTKMISSARFISQFFEVIPGILMPIIIDLVHKDMMGTSLRKVFFAFGLFAGIVGMGIFSLAGIFEKERVVQSSDEPSFAECMKGLYTNRPLRLLLLREFMGSLGSIKDVVTPYYYVDVLNNYSSSIVTGIPGTVSTLLSYSLIQPLRRLMNNKHILILIRIVDSALPSLKYIAGLGGRFKKLSFMMAVISIEGLLNGFLTGPRMVVPTDMIGETVDYAEWTTGKRTEGISFSVITFVGKFNNAVSRGLGLFLLSLTGYKTSNESSQVAQTESTKKGIFALHTIIPALLGMFGMIPILFYDLIGEKRERMYRELDEMRSTTRGGGA